MPAFIQYGGIRLDVMVNTTGVKSLRTDMAALTRVMHEAQGPAGKLTRDLQRLAVVNKEGKVDQETSKVMMDAIIARYLKSAKSVQEYEKAIAHLIAVAPQLKPQLEAMAQQYRATAEAEQLAAAKTRQANNLARQARRDAMAEVQKAERDAERAARKAHRDAEAEIARNKKLVDSANMLAAGKNKAARQVVRDLERINQAYATGNLSATANKQAQDNVVEAFLRGAKGPREMAAAVDFLKSRYPGLHTFIQITVDKINAEAAADRAAADAKRAAARARKEAEAQAKADLAVVSNLYKKAAGDVGVYTEKLRAIKAVAAAGSASQTQLNMAIRQAAKEYFANAKSVQDVIAARKKLVELAPQEQAAINAAANAKRKEITATEAQIAADRKAKEEKRANAHAQQFLTSVIQAGMSPMDRLISHEARLNALLAAGRITTQQYAQAIQSLRAQMQSLTNEVSLADQLTRRFLSIAFAKEISQRAIALQQDSVNAFIALRDNLVKLEVIVGDVAAAKRLYIALRQIAVQTNQTTDNVMRSAVTMAQFGVSTNSVVPSMNMLSQIAAGNSDRLQSLALAYGQVAAAGRLTGQETLQFVNAGFSPLAEMARTTGKDMRQLRKEMEAGNISFAMVTNSLRTATSEGGRFFGMGEKLSGEYSGAVSRLNDSFTQLKETIGELTAKGGVLDAMSEILTGLRIDIESLAAGRGFGPIGTYLFKGTELGAEVGTMNALEVWMASSGVSQAERDQQNKAEIESLNRQEREREENRRFTEAMNNIRDRNAPAFEHAMLLVANGIKSTEQAAEEFYNNAAITDTELMVVDPKLNMKAVMKEIVHAAEEVKNALQSKITQVQEFVDKLEADAQLSDLDQFFKIREKLDFAVSQNIISVAEAQSLLAQATAPLINLMEAQTSAAQKYNDEHMRMSQFLNAGAISVQQFNDHMTLFRDELNKPFLDRAKQIRESIKTPAERDAELIRELAALINAGILGEKEATKFLMQQAQENSQAMNTDLPQSVSLGTREAYDLMNKVNNQIATGQLNLQRQQLLEQKKANELLQQINAKPDIGIVN